MYFKALVMKNAYISSVCQGYAITCTYFLLLLVAPTLTYFHVMRLTAEGATPVSYTHLDVYKRQDYVFAKPPLTD